MAIWNLIKKQKKIIPEIDLDLGKDPKVDLINLISACKNSLPSVDVDLITKAFNWCYETHKNKLLKSGLPYYTHPLAVAHIVISEMPLDDISVASALLHNIVDEGDSFVLKDIQSEFGSTIAEIIEQVIKIKYIEGKNIEEVQMENYRKMLLSLFKDVRIILIKLADRLHNMRSIEYFLPEKQYQMARETLEIYAPFAHRFGLGTIKWELEDIAFKFTNKEDFDKINQDLQQTRAEREEYIEIFSSPIRERLHKDEILMKKNIKFEISGRPKHIFSIYNKMKNRGLPMSELYDLFAIRIILDTDDSSYCFIVYGIISDIYKAVPGTFKDYISNPKNNGYQSIHTAVYDIAHNKSVEVQIRTRKMHEIAELGVAAHFNYKRGFLPAQSVMDERNIDEWMGLVRNIFENAGEESAEELIERVKKNLFADEIFVFTPANEFRVFPKEATPLDFAFAIHTDIGYHCIGAKVNGKVVPLNYKIQNGDMIEIITSKNQQPSKEWLKSVVTQRAKSNIIRYLKEEKRTVEDDGRYNWDQYVIKNKSAISEIQFNEMLKYFKFNNADEFYSAIGTHELDVSVAYQHIKESIHESGSTLINGDNNRKSDNGIKKETKFNIDSIGNKIKNTSLRVSYSKCCTPIPGDKIVGLIKTGNEIIVHRRNCQQIQYMLNSHMPSIFEMDWSKINDKNFNIKIKIIGEDRKGMLNDISASILSLDMNIQGVSVGTNDMGFEGILSVNVKNLEQLDKIFDVLKTIDGVKTVDRFSEI